MNVKALVYITAFGLDERESLAFLREADRPRLFLPRLQPTISAERWVTPTNVIMSYTTLPSGNIKMKVIMPTNEWRAMGRDMKVADGNCKVMDVIPGADTAEMVLACTGPTP